MQQPLHGVRQDKGMQRKASHEQGWQRKAKM
jgi:hypothetical protein